MRSSGAVSKDGVTAADFRDGFLVSFLVAYDWESSAHVAELAVRGKDGVDRTFRVTGLESWNAFEDFRAQHIDRCTLLQEASGIYLCLDPQTEGERSYRDNFWLVGTGVARCGP